jgi:AcrR family transcriptional regulator
MAGRRKPRDEARKAKNDVYRQHILDAAERVFAERGYETAKVQDISALAGLSMGTIYAVFPGKLELFTAILEGHGEAFVALVREVADRNLPPRAALTALIDVYINYFVEHPNFLRTQLRSGISWALGTTLNSPNQLQYSNDIHALQAEIFRRGIAAGEFVGEDPAYLSRLFSVIDQVLLADWVANGMQATPAELIARMQTQVDRSFFAPKAARG